MRVLHIEAGRHLYGGPRQVLLLLDGLRAAGIVSALACPRDSAIRSAARGAELMPLKMGGDLDVGLVARLRDVIARFGPDIVHVHSRRGADWYGPLAARLAGVPVVLSRRVDNPETPIVARAKYALVERVIAISERIREVALESGVPATKVICVRSAVPPALPAARDRAWIEQQFGITQQAPLIAVIAQLIKRKGHRFLIDAMPQVLAAHPHTRCLVLGRGPLAASLRQRAETLGVADAVLFAGFRDDLERILPNLDLLVHPALREGLGIALLQAAQAGVAIVASEAGGLREAVADGQTGLLVPAGDPAALASAITGLLDDPTQRRALGAAGAARVATDFSPAAMVAGNLRVYREVLRGE